MKLITRETDYAVRALCYIAGKRGEVVSVTELVRKMKIPRPFLRKILQILTQEGLLESYKGQGGGFVLGRQAAEIHLTDLITAFQGDLKLNQCIFKKRLCPNRDSCSLRQEILGIEQDVIGRMKRITIASLANGNGYHG